MYHCLCDCLLGYVVSADVGCSDNVGEDQDDVQSHAGNASRQDWSDRGAKQWVILSLFSPTGRPTSPTLRLGLTDDPRRRRFVVIGCEGRVVPSPRLTRAVGKISLPSTTLHFFDLGGQRDIRSIWPKYYDECHAVVFVLDACDQARLSETWEVFGASSSCCLHPINNSHSIVIIPALTSTSSLWPSSISMAKIAESPSPATSD